jgi:hypothetical protein
VGFAMSAAQETHPILFDHTLHAQPQGWRSTLKTHDFGQQLVAVSATGVKVPKTTD